MPDYSKSIIYKLCCKDPAITDIYIGSTTNFRRRKCTHKHGCNNEKSKSYNLNVYSFIRENGNWDNWDMIQIETCNADNKRYLETRERYWIEELKSSLNCKIPTQTATEYRENNKEKLAEYDVEYREKNKEKLIEYRKKNKEKINETSAEHYQKNKEKKAEYYQNNKEKITEYREKRKEKVICECGSEVRKDSLTRHKKSKKHINSIIQN